ncbi:hypothetical protein GOBAR_AA06472 [Gossypium barbadense]|uniref:Uncharacterized protein n=1 Tax=Gossypium barbadense TaxID=3634 RepID=A0A2P5YET1_GOSBA|nr:hypothetical protein GOBAR_AA06472 [Gossypium barbadense]
MRPVPRPISPDGGVKEVVRVRLYLVVGYSCRRAARYDRGKGTPGQKPGCRGSIPVVTRVIIRISGDESGKR